MPVRPSDPLLSLLRDTARKKGHTTAGLSAQIGVERAALKKALAGEVDLTVDQFILIAQALELSPTEVGLPEDTPVTPADDWAPDPLGNLARQALRVGFGLGVDLFCTFDATQLRTSGVPENVLSRFPEQLPIRLEAKYHRHNKPEFGEREFSCTLSFDRLYTCTFPWSALKQVTFHMPEEDALPPQPPPPPEPKGKPGFHLRVVK